MNPSTQSGAGTGWSLTALAIPDVKLIVSPRRGDARGFFSETWRASLLNDWVGDATFVQENHVYSAAPLTMRGLHFQAPPHAQAKLIRVIHGAIFDVAVDLRRGSPTYGRHVTTVLSRENWRQVWIPAGFAHGYCTLEPDTEITYKVTAPYAPAHERGLRWDDPALGIAWPAARDSLVMAARDDTWPGLDALPGYFAAADRDDAGRRP
ncbi:MAG: dTDP-4-dehydrorhamnose 3,5-epimerase [Alphaproteobacteria bacterium]|nr:dTDP-4-dehydrorhamnose 3,5-epimerase [Alphaproteobacteria bacterium]